MKRLLTLLLVAFFLWPVAANSITQYKTSNSASEGLSLTLDDPIGSIYQEGEEVGFTIRTDRDAYVVVFNIDTEGFVHLLYPQDRKNLRKFSANRIHYIPEDREQTLVVGGTTGIEFVFAVAVENRDYINEEEIGFLAANDITPDSNNFQIDGDPLLAANRVASQLVRGISHRRGVTMSYTYFYINEAVDFPRYLCEECYTNGKDPYGPGMPNYVAYADFENTDRLTYPLEQGFVREGNDNLGLNPQLGNTSVTTAYISYYPRWDDGFYSTAWWYNDPSYWGTPYYGSSFYFSVGWNWGWGGWGNCHYRYFPYYYNGPYYACGPNWGYYDCYPTQFYYPTHYDNAFNRRSFRPTPKGSGSGLHTAMNQTSTRDLRARQRSLKSSYAKDGLRRTGGRTDLARTFRGTRDARTYTGKDPLVIRSRPLKGYDRSTRKSLARSSKKVSPRDRRVITSSQTRRATARGSKGSVNTQGIRRTSSSMSRKIGQTGTYRGNVPKSGTRSKSSTSRTYKPNTRKSSGSSVRSKSGSGTRSNYKAPASRSSSGGKSSARSSGRSSGSRSSSRSSGGKGRK